jgi:hypothetical protein
VGVAAFVKRDEFVDEEMRGYIVDLRFAQTDNQRALIIGVEKREFRDGDCGVERE